MMRAEAKSWLAASDRDEAMARELLKTGLYEGVAFHSQQAAEKALKALVLVIARSPRTHSCVELLDLLENAGRPVPDDVQAAARRLDIHYIASRYPNGAGGPPESLYDEKLAQEALEWMSAIKEFAKSQMP